jgi:hypothetical protein
VTHNDRYWDGFGDAMWVALAVALVSYDVQNILRSLM